MTYQKYMYSSAHFLQNPHELILSEGNKGVVLNEQINFQVTDSMKKAILPSFLSILVLSKNRNAELSWLYQTLLKNYLKVLFLKGLKSYFNHLFNYLFFLLYQFAYHLTYYASRK